MIVLRIDNWRPLFPAALEGVDRHPKEVLHGVLVPCGTVHVVQTRSGALARISAAWKHRSLDLVRYREDRSGD